MKKESCGCVGCAFDSENANTCQSFLRIKDVPHCSSRHIIFVEKPQSAVTKEITDKNAQKMNVSVKNAETDDANESFVGFCQESSWGVNSNGRPEIRVDRLIENSVTAPNKWSFQIQMDEGYRPAQINVIASKTAENCKFTAAILPDTECFIVCLVESGKLAPSDSPKQHKTREIAEKEANRLCKLHRQEFVVLQVVSAIKPQEPKKEVLA